MSDIKLYGPYTIHMKVYVTDGEQTAIATWSAPDGKPLDGIDAKGGLEACLKSVKEGFGKDWRLCTKREFFTELMREKTGTAMQFSVPGGDEWDVGESM